MKPILFNTEMVRAILSGRKRVTRRAVKDADPGWDFVGLEKRPCELRVNTDGEEYPKELDWPCAVFSAGSGYCDYPMRKVPYWPGDILYVRETFGTYNGDYYLYRADYPDGATTYDFDGHRCDLPRWHPSIHMPREAARIFLWVADVRVERLQDSFCRHGSAILLLQREGIDIGEQCRDCIKAYGSPCCSDDDSECGVLDEVRGEFSDLWDSTIKPADRDLYGWAANPWVWVITFERISREEAGL